jgi:hypothetical protein
LIFERRASENIDYHDWKLYMKTGKEEFKAYLGQYEAAVKDRLK